MASISSSQVGKIIAFPDICPWQCRRCAGDDHAQMQSVEKIHEAISANDADVKVARFVKRRQNCPSMRASLRVSNELSDSAFSTLSFSALTNVRTRSAAQLDGRQWPAALRGARATPRVRPTCHAARQKSQVLALADSPAKMGLKSGDYMTWPCRWARS